MTDTPDISETGDGLLDGILFAALAVVSIGAAAVGWHALSERLRRKDETKEIER
jgi:hypothetical protein